MPVKKNFYKEDKTPFSQWLRDKSGIDSWDGYRVYDVDFLWGQKLNNGQLAMLFIEEKCKNALMNPDQFLFYIHMTNMIEYACMHYPSADLFLGFHFIRFENTTPDDGLMWLDDKLITIPKLQEFLRFDIPTDDIYTSYHHKLEEAGIDWRERTR